MASSIEVVPRRAQRVVGRMLDTLRVAVLNGPRQAGKTTLARQVHAARGGTFVSFDDDDLLGACLADPKTFVTSYPKPLIVDEFQRAGDRLLRAVKAVVDADPSPGQFLLTGSTRFLTVPTISESLAGRVGIVDLWPYSQGEIRRLDERADSFLARLVDPRAETIGLAYSDLPGRRSYLSMLCLGGFPEVQRLAAAAERRRWFEGYVRTVTQRDVPDISRVRRASELPKLLEGLAAWSGQQLVAARLAEKVSLARSTLEANYLPLLETVYLTVRLPAWSRNLMSRVAKHPKLYLSDSGLAAHVLHVDERALADPVCPATGPLIETFVVNELLRQASFLDDGISLFHFRAHSGPEVDVIAETADDRVGGVEVKAAASVQLRDFRHLASVRDRVDAAGGRFVRGVVLYTGDRVLVFGDRLIALPLAAMWLPPS